MNKIYLDFSFTIFPLYQTPLVKKANYKKIKRGKVTFTLKYIYNESYYSHH